MLLSAASSTSSARLACPADTARTACTVYQASLQRKTGGPTYTLNAVYSALSRRTSRTTRQLIRVHQLPGFRDLLCSFVMIFVYTSTHTLRPQLSSVRDLELYHVTLKFRLVQGCTASLLPAFSESTKCDVRSSVCAYFANGSSGLEPLPLRFDSPDRLEVERKGLRRMVGTTALLTLSSKAGEEVHVRLKSLTIVCSHNSFD